MAEHVLDLVLLRHVGFVCISLGARSTDCVDYRLGGILAGHVINHDIGTGLPESDRGRLADVGWMWTGWGSPDKALPSADAPARQRFAQRPLSRCAHASTLLFFFKLDD